MIRYNIYLCLLALCLVQKTLSEHYHFARRIRTCEEGNLDVYIFETVLKIAIQQCVETCKTRIRCKYINYHVRMKCCFLIGSASNVQPSPQNVLDEKAGYVFISMTDWNMGAGSMCVNCIDSACLIPEERKNAKVLGNMFTVGSKVEYMCADGFNMNLTDISRTICKRDRTWSATVFKCLPEIVFTADVLMFNGIYYKLVREKRTWYQSMKYCDENGGYLADILSQQEQDIAFRLAKYTVNGLWIGGRKINNQFKWTNGINVNNGYSNWYPGQPYHSDNTETCTIMLKVWHYSWDDTVCYARHESVCKIIDK